MRCTAEIQWNHLERLIQQRNASAQTVAAYRDSFRLLLRFAQQHLGKSPQRLALTDLDGPLVLAYLNHLEVERHDTIRSRNARFAAIRWFLQFAALKEPAALPVLQRVLAIPTKRFAKPCSDSCPRPKCKPFWRRRTRPPGADDVTASCSPRYLPQDLLPVKNAVGLTLTVLRRSWCRYHRHRAVACPCRSNQGNGSR